MQPGVRLFAGIGILFVLFFVIDLHAKPLGPEVTVPRVFVVNNPIQAASELDYPPFAVVNSDGTAGGFSVDLLTAAVKAVGLEITFKVGPWAQIKNDLAEGRLDVLPLVGRTPEREHLYDFTFTYFTMHGAAFVRRNDERIQRRSDLKGMNIAVMEGDNAYEYLLRSDLSSTITTTKTYEEAFRGLAASRWDAVVAQRLMGLRLIQTLSLDKLEPRLILRDFTQEFSFAVKDGNYPLLAKLNEGLAITMSDGTFSKLQEKWITPIEQPSMARRVLPSLIGLAIVLTLILGVVVIWNRILRRLVAKRTRQLEEINAHLQQQQATLEQTVSERTKENLLMQQQVFRTVQLASLGQLAAGVAHEINNPLMIVSGYTDLVRQAMVSLPESEFINNSLTKISNSVNRIASIVKSLQTLGRKSSEVLSSVDVVPLIEEIVGLLIPIYAQHNAVLTLELPSEKEAWVIGASQKIHQVLLNLLSNAHDAVVEQGGGTITVSLSNVGDFWIIEVCDTGPGIPAELLPNLFSPFYTTKPVGAGTGLGLSIAHSLTVEMGGTLDVTAKSFCGGASFKVQLPRVVAGNIVEEKSGENKAKLPSKPIRVLVVDDEPLLCEMVETYFRQLGLEVKSATSAREAINLLQSESVDILLTDVLMSDMNACQFVAEADRKGLLLNTKLIAMTGGVVSTYPKELVSFLESRVSLVVAKPLALESLAQILLEKEQSSS